MPEINIGDQVMLNSEMLRRTPELQYLRHKNIKGTVLSWDTRYDCKGSRVVIIKWEKEHIIPRSWPTSWLVRTREELTPLFLIK